MFILANDPTGDAVAINAAQVRAVEAVSTGTSVVLGMGGDIVLTRVLAHPLHDVVRALEMAVQPRSDEPVLVKGYKPTH